MPLYQYHSLLSPELTGWRMAGAGGFRLAPDGAVESYGGPGLLWYEVQIYENFILRVEWRLMRGDDNSGVFLRCPPLQEDLAPAFARAYEIQIDDRGYDPEKDVCRSALHITGAIYRLAPAKIVASRGVALWNEFEITARGGLIDVRLNGEEVSSLTNADREPRGHIALQAHHEGSHVQFRNLQIRRLED
ncbi:MAG TPA: DUF1080 domain-containing protein [Steroidobacter sp.]|nr:DUF1080 domain-containing protein [Steroidobacter sp.]